jgi:hypothetical protein
MPFTRFVSVGLVAGTLGLWPGPASAQDSEEPPEGVEQIVPRGAIPAVFEPHFVPAHEAEIQPDAWVLGVVVDGEARAYSLNLLNRHEIVNDKIGEKAFAAVW